MNVVVRFAPSPTGHMHIGNVRTAMLNWLFALQNRGRFILRFDDTDRERSRPEYADSILRDLHWLSVVPHQIEHQSLRMESYLKAAEILKAKCLLYPCYETPEELEISRKILLSRHLPPVYDRRALRLTDDEKDKFHAQGRVPHWRFLLPNYDSEPFKPSRTMIDWHDLVRGPQSVDLSSLSDPILVRENGTFPYTLPSVVDDLDFHVTHILRGGDHITNTAVQIALFKALGSSSFPQFGHHNLFIANSGEVLSKRDGSASVSGFNQEGIEPMVLASYAVLSGSSSNVVVAQDMDALSQKFDVSKLTLSPARFDPLDLKILNQSFFQNLSFECVKDRLEALTGSDPRAEFFWNAVCGNIQKFSDVLSWWGVISENFSSSLDNFSVEDREFVRSVFDSFPCEPWDREILKQWSAGASATSGRKGKAFYSPLRFAITGSNAGPDLVDFMLLIGRKALLKRRP